MAKRLLIDGTIPQETRIALLDGNTLADYDIEFSDARPLRSNVYLAKVIRVEPSLQAAFVEYGGNRQGFLPFGEIHPDYFRIPTSDREELLAEEAEEQDDDSDDEPNGIEEPADEDSVALADSDSDLSESEEDSPELNGAALEEDPESEGEAEGAPEEQAEGSPEGQGDRPVRRMSRRNRQNNRAKNGSRSAERRQTRRQARYRYKIQEVIQRNQVMLVQIIKDERPGKGAAVTTYISLAGRYCVLMPNSDHAGGVSRKVSSASQRDKLRKIIEHLEVPEKMAVILRTAGSERTRTEIRRDYESLLNLWEDIRQRTLESTAPCLIHEEGSLIRRALRDLYTGDEEEILVEGDTAWQEARDAMKVMMPSHIRKVRQWDAAQSLFARHQVEKSLSGVHQPKVRLRSGGEIVIAQTEALVAIDVNSGRSTRERHIENTAFKTNLEAAKEIARQLKIRDLAGLVVIDFIDMDSGSHIRDVERTLRDALQNDRARVQVGRISQFGLLELSRQRLRASISESSTITCTACDGTGRMSAPSADGAAVLRQLIERLRRRKGGNYVLRMAPNVAEYLLNKRRSALLDLEKEHGATLTLVGDPSIPMGGEVRIEAQAERNGRRGGRGRASPYDDTQDGLEEADEEDDRDSLEGRSTTRRRRGRNGRNDGNRRQGRRRTREDFSHDDSRDSYEEEREEENAEESAPIESAEDSSQDEAPTKKTTTRRPVRKSRKTTSKTASKSKVAKRKTTRKEDEPKEESPKKKSTTTARVSAAKVTAKTATKSAPKTASKTKDSSDKPKRKGWWS